jgi:chromosome segregation ATPase
MESAEESVTSEDPWIPGGKATLSEAHARILLLEDEVVKHIIASEEAQSVITETKEQLEETHKRLDEALEDVTRLRGERNFAREKAERHAMDANAWRTEVQTTLPEMQALIRKQQEESKALYVSRLAAFSEKANPIPRRLEHSPR